MCCEGCPRRYLVVFLGFLGLMLSIGLRTCFTVVMVQVTTPPEHRKCNTTSDDFYLNVSRSEVNYMYTAYYVGSFFTQFPGGMLAVRFPPKLVTALSIFVTGVLFIVIPFALQYCYPLVFVIRAVQGLVEGVSVPSLNGVVAAWAPKSEKSRIVCFVYSGAYLSPAVALLMTGNVFICFVSWNSIFFCYGGVCVLWCVVWLLLVKDTPAQHRGLGEREATLFDREGPNVRQGDLSLFQGVPWLKIFSSTAVWATFVGAFCRNWIFCLLLTQEPQYFQDVFHYDIDENTGRSSIPHILMTVVVISGGFLFDQLQKSGLRTTVVRKLAETLGFGIEACCIMGMAFVSDNKDVAFILLCVGVGLSGLAISGYQVNPLDLSPQYAAVLTGLVRMGTLGGIASTIVAAVVTGNGHTYEEWRNVLIIAASIHMGGVVFFLVFASGDRQPWGQPIEIQVTPEQEAARGERRSLLGDTPSINSAMDGGELEWSDRFSNSMG